ncbi:LLM class flavin-dependent oxidoreductase [Acidisoma silvae]|uniref:LLM class flavin-dependent oxidoreductase n=1 Tax=Acidisoma silvae TaxID=2802396 RepID=A0A963YPG2_9PROT|nr:LLM class flavin-dependent oxidoreductase [Acidisoma silvae]MCB8874609.1 LLM class flavin-dependent oxidoreductase [Acidisoma silvae]
MSARRDGRQIHFMLLEMGAISHNNYGLWRHPDNQRRNFGDLAFWIEQARQLERGMFDAIFFADTLGISAGFGGAPDVALREGMHVPIHDPLTLIPAMAAVTKHLGFAATSSTTYEHPFSFARRMSSLDMLSGGRVGWNIVTSYLPGAAANFGIEPMPHETRYDRAQEYAEVAFKLWEQSWDEDAVRLDKEASMVSDPAKVHAINHEGTHFKVAGPHLMCPTPQRTPVIFQAGSSDRGREFAAKHAEGIFIGGYTEDILLSHVQDIRRIAAAAGRGHDEVRLFAEGNVVCAATDAEAEAKLADYMKLASADGYLAHRFGSGMDLSRYGHHEKIEDIVAAGGPGADHMARYPFPAGWTVGDIIEDAARLDRKRLFVCGGPEKCADEIERWSDTFDLDGFLMRGFLAPGTARDFADFVVPELQRRGRYRTQYEGTTLRENLFGAGHKRLPDSHPGAAYRRAPQGAE